MDFYVILGVGPMRARRTSSARIGGCRGGITRASTRATAPPRRRSRRISEAYEVADRSAAAAGLRPGRAPAPAPAPSGVPQFTEFDFSVRAHGAQASTFSELFAEVLHPVPRPDAGRPEPGADLHATLTVPFEDRSCTGDERQVVVTRQVSCSACRGAGRPATPEGRCARCDGRGPDPLGARPHGVHEGVRGLRRDGRQRSERAPPAPDRARGAQRGGDGARAAGRARRDAAARRRARATRGRHGGAQRRSLRHRPRRAASAVPPARATTCSARCRSRCTKRCSARVSKCRRSTGRSRLQSAAGHAGRAGGSGCSGRGVPRAVGERGDLVVEVRIVLPRRSTSVAGADSRIRRLNPEDVRKI